LSARFAKGGTGCITKKNGAFWRAMLAHEQLQLDLMGVLKNVRNKRPKLDVGESGAVLVP
jgi:hypothetical protein